MTSKERVIRTLTFRLPDRVPVDFWCLPATCLKYGKALEKIISESDIDILSAPFNDPAEDVRHYQIGSYTDVWGWIYLWKMYARDCKIGIINLKMKKLKICFLAIISLLATNNLSAQIISTIQDELTTPWLGFGYNQWGYPRMADGSTFRPWDEELWNTTRERILAIQPALVRLPLMREWFNQDDNGNDLPIGTYNWNSHYMQSFYRIMDLYKEQNIAVFSGLWHSAYDPQGKEPAGFYVSADFARLQADLIEYLVNTKGYTNILLYTPTNEPLGSFSDFNLWKTMMKNLYNELSGRHLPTNLLSGADSWSDWTWLPARENKSELSGYDFHYYLNDTPTDTYNLLYNRTLETNLSNMVNRIYQEDNTNKPVIVSEMAPIGVPYIDWPVEEAPAHCRIDTYEYGLNFIEYGIQLMRSKAASGLAWGLDGFDQNKNAGMWNNAGTYGGIRLRPWYYAWSLMCRYFPANSTVLKMSELNGRKDLRIAGIRTAGGNYSFALTNRRYDAASATRQVTLKAPGGAKTFYLYSYSSENYGNGNDLSLPYITLQTNDLQNEGICIDIPLETAVILTTLPPLPPKTKLDAEVGCLDFEQLSGYFLSFDSNQGVEAAVSTNPRKREPNLSDNVCRITQSGNENALITIVLDSLFVISSEKPNLSFQVYKNGTDTDFKLKIATEDFTYQSGVFTTGNRTWKEYHWNLNSLIGKKIESFSIQPNIHYNSSENNIEYTYFDNFQFRSSENVIKNVLEETDGFIFIYSLEGRLIYQTQSQSSGYPPTLQAGIYIVKQGTHQYLVKIR